MSRGVTHSCLASRTPMTRPEKILLQAVIQSGPQKKDMENRLEPDLAWTLARASLASLELWYLSQPVDQGM